MGAQTSLVTPNEPCIRPGESGPAVTLSRGMLVERSARLDLAAASSRGKRHAINEDWHSALDTRRPVFVVADGVGGGALAARASRALVEHVHGLLEQTAIGEAAIRDALLDADRAIARSIAAETSALGAATVALCAALGEDVAQWLVGWVGDCRVYRVNGSGGELLTRDDSYRALCETPPPGSAPDDPARMVGNGAVIDPNVGHVALACGEMLVLCSDGVHKHVGVDDIATLLGSAGPLARRCAKLVSLARARGSGDDATVLVVHRLPIDRPQASNEPEPLPA
jgi:protein phosphatase